MAGLTAQEDPLDASRDPLDEAGTADGQPSAFPGSRAARSQTDASRLSGDSLQEADSQDTASPKTKTSSGQQRTRERNRKAQQAYRQRSKVKYQKQEQKIRDLESRIASLQSDRPLGQNVQPTEQHRELKALEERVEGLQREQQARSEVDGRSNSQQDPQPPHSASLSLTPPSDPHGGARQESGRAHPSLDMRLLPGAGHGEMNEASSVNSAGVPDTQGGPGRSLMQPLANFGQERASHMLPQEMRRQNLQGLVPHPEWAAATPLPLAQLYMALVEGQTDLQLPLPNMHPDKAVMLSRLASMSLADFATFTAPCQAYLAYTAPFVRDPTTEMGKRFAATAAEALCVRVVLCEVRPNEFLQTLGRHLLQPGPGNVQLPPDWSQIKDLIGLTDVQRLLVKDIWRRYAQSMLAIAHDRAAIIADLNASGYAAIAPLQNSAQAVCVMEQASGLAASLALQQETYIHLIRMFLVQVLTPFQFAHFHARSYPYMPAWGEIIFSVADS
ncbi:hypothetical protein WJX84_009000 [Apatococcus fuscideae]|uniref:BZIP domain-containing protein n=1 Tax=Apatococcus fuscideae TaxID=2026836 RepID=A0AAW1TEG1_9CHLO